jgi:3-dehydroquinate dehydratase type I
VQLFVTILEDSLEPALAAIRAIDAGHDGIEVRVERFAAVDFAALRAVTPKPLIVTWRGSGPAVALESIPRALDAGIDLVDVEWSENLDGETLARFAGRIVLSHHDYEGMGDVERVFDAMSRLGCAHTKLAATPRTLAENLRLLALLPPTANRQPSTVVGMGERGLYSRIVAPFRGSALAFVTAGAAAAPGQLSLERALDIYGPDRESLRAERTFAVAGDPAGHSLSPSIHNRLFREKRVRAAYAVASVEHFGEVLRALEAGELAGVSVTAPFKEEAFAYASSGLAQLGEHARASGAVNTLVRTPEGTIADNTDVDGFRTILAEVCGRDRKSVAIVGAGGTARAALVAVEREGMPAAIFNRTPGRLGARPLEDLRRWDGEVIIDTTPADLDLPFRAGMTYIRAAYGIPSRAIDDAASAGARVFDGIDLLQAQAVRQHELFMRALDGLREAEG